MPTSKRGRSGRSSSPRATPGPIPGPAPGEHLVKELRWIHGVLRRDLRSIQGLSAQVGAGAAAERVGGRVRGMQTRSPLFQLRVNCLSYCQVVHSHHGNEDARLFPALRRHDRGLAPTVDRLEADHRRVSDLLDQVQALADLLGQDDTPAVRRRLSVALDELSRHLLAHLEFEEKAVLPVLRQWSRWP